MKTIQCTLMICLFFICNTNLFGKDKGDTITYSNNAALYVPPAEADSNIHKTFSVGNITYKQNTKELIIIHSTNVNQKLDYAFNYFSTATSLIAQAINIDIANPSAKAIANIPLTKTLQRLTVNAGFETTDNLADIIKDKKVLFDFFTGFDWNLGLKKGYKNDEKAKIFFFSIKNLNTFTKVKLYDSSYKFVFGTDSIQGRIYEKPKTDFMLNVKFNFYSLKNGRKLYFNFGPVIHFGNIIFNDLKEQKINYKTVDSSYSPSIAYTTTDNNTTAFFSEQYHWGLKAGFETELYIIGDKNIGFNAKIGFESKIAGKNQRPSNNNFVFKFGPIINGETVGDKTAVSIFPYFEYRLALNKSNDSYVTDKVFDFGLVLSTPFNWPDRKINGRRRR